MGSWSECCALSGMEIREGDECYVATVGLHPYAEATQVFHLPPIKGTYADYGHVDLLESNTQFNLQKGKMFEPRNIEDSNDDDDEFEDEEEQPRRITGQVVYFRASVVDFLHNLEPEFNYYGSERVDTIGDIVARSVENSQKGVIDSVAKAKKYADDLNFGVLVPIFIRDSVSEEIQANINEYINELIRSGVENFDEVFKFYSRCILLSRSQHELRKLIVPGIRGPQHQGSEALIQFYQFVLDTARKEKAEFDAS